MTINTRRLAVLTRSLNRFNSLYGAAKAAEKISNKEKAASYYSTLLSLKEPKDCDRPEFSDATAFLAKVAVR